MLDNYQAFFYFFISKFQSNFILIYQNKKIFLYINYYIINTLINDKTYILY